MDEKRIALARRMIAAAESEAWREVILPYLRSERDNLVEQGASQTDPLQAMRYFGAMQLVNNLLRMEETAHQTIRLSQQQPESIAADPRVKRV